MKNILLGFLSINISILFNLVVAISDDCIRLNSFLMRENVECCGTGIIECDNEGFITKLELGDQELINKPLFTQFPIFSKVIRIYLEAPLNLNPPNEFPLRFLDQPMLNILTVRKSQISNIPVSVNTNCPVYEINLDHNDIVDYPYQFKDLPNIGHLYLHNNKVSGTVDLNGFKTIKQIDIGENQIDDVINIPKDVTSLHLDGNSNLNKVPSEIPDLANLRELDLRNTGITEIPSDLFKLKGLSYFKISGNPQLKTKIINFGNKAINECELDDVEIECYQPGTCKNIDESEYTPCTESQIDEVKNGSHSSFLNTYVIIGGLLAAIIIIQMIIKIKNKIKRNRQKNKYNDINNHNSDNNDKNYDIIIRERIIKTDESKVNSNNNETFINDFQEVSSDDNNNYNSINSNNSNSFNNGNMNGYNNTNSYDNTNNYNNSMDNYNNMNNNYNNSISNNYNNNINNNYNNNINNNYNNNINNNFNDNMNNYNNMDSYNNNMNNNYNNNINDYNNIMNNNSMGNINNGINNNYSMAYNNMNSNNNINGYNNINTNTNGNSNMNNGVNSFPINNDNNISVSLAHNINNNNIIIPNVNSPNANSPNVNSPNANSPNVNSPNVNSPNFNNPNFNNPNFNNPNFNNPNFNNSNFNNPNFNNPNFNNSNFNNPNFNNFNVNGPNVNSPNVNSPNVNSPNFNNSNINNPNVSNPNVNSANVDYLNIKNNIIISNNNNNNDEIDDELPSYSKIFSHNAISILDKKGPL